MLADSRNVSMAGALPIPVTEILAYCQLLYIDTLIERERILRHVKRLDSVYLSYLSKKSDTTAAAPQAGPVKPPSKAPKIGPDGQLEAPD